MANRTTGALFVMAALAIPSAAMAQRWGRDPFPGSGACFFRDSEFRGEYFCVRAGENVWRVPDEMNDRISSIRTFGRFQLRVFDALVPLWRRLDKAIPWKGVSVIAVGRVPNCSPEDSSSKNLGVQKYE